VSEAGGWKLNVDRKRVIDTARKHARNTVALTRDEQLHEALGFVLAAMIIMQMNGTFRHTVDRWVREWTAEVYGWMN
jgi:hypothetical protein